MEEGRVPLLDIDLIIRIFNAFVVQSSIHSRVAYIEVLKYEIGVMK